MVKFTVPLSDILGNAYYRYELVSSNYNPSIDSNITITCTCKNVLGNPIANKTLELFQNGSSVGTATTNANGIATWTITCSNWGLQDFRVANTNIQVRVIGCRTTNPHIYYSIYEWEDKVGVKIAISDNINFTTSWRSVNNSIIPYRLRPRFPVTMVGLNATSGQQNIAFGVRESADHTKTEIIVKSLTGSTVSTQLYNYIEWSKV